MRLKKALLLGLSLWLPTALFGSSFGTVEADSLNLRMQPSTNASIITQVHKGTEVEIINNKAHKGWYQLLLKDGKTAFAKQEYIAMTKVEGEMTTGPLNIRSYPDINKSRVLVQAQQGEVVEIYYKVGSFYKVRYKGQFGFAYAAYIESSFSDLVKEVAIDQVREIKLEASGFADEASTSHEEAEGSSDSKAEVIPDKEETESATDKGEEIVSFALKHLGAPYVYAGNSLTTGVDCSGFTQQVMKQHGISIPRSSSSQSTVGTKISGGALEKGDLLFFGTTVNSISHVGIYIGNGQMIHSSTPSTGVIISNAYLSGGNPLQVARRVY